jgi:hypothetical protein
MASSERALLPEIEVWPVLAFCTPVLLGFALFFVSFPIDRQIPFWPHLNLAELFMLWFFFITPVTTVSAVVTLIKRERRVRISLFTQFLLWTTVTVCWAINAFMWLGLWASTS